jgi:hypothetical protein
MTTIDPLGHKTVLNEGGAEPSEGTVFTFLPIDADVEVQMQGSATDDGPGEVLLGITPYVFFARTAAVGVSIARPDLSNPDILRVAPSLKVYIDVDPTDRWLKFVKFSPLSYSFPLGEDAGFSGSGLSTDSKLTAGTEIPVGANLAFQAEAGVISTFSHLGEDVDDHVDFTTAASAIWRIRP